MSNIEASNMTSRQYCPNCGSFSMQRLRRGYIKKVIMKISAQYKCMECEEQTSKAVMDDNELKSVPLFINAG